MKILVAIASYGSRNDAYLHQLLAEYSAMPYEVDVVVLSNAPKAGLAADIEVVVGLPSSNPWSLPFAHKPIFERRAADYDLFIYSEDDTLVTEANVEAFLWATSVLEPDEIAGFMRSEQGPDDRLYYSTIHNHYHWAADSVRRRAGETFAHFTNEHGACYILTQDQLRRAIASGGFSVAPHEGKYDMLVSAATDPYTQCGFKKLLCISRIDQFTCKHLTNKYVGRTGVQEAIVQTQFRAMIEMDTSAAATAASLPVQSKLPGTRWIKSYYEPVRDDLVALFPPSVRRVLSIGCGWGSTEEALVQRGLEVTAVPLDAIIGRVAEQRGVRVISCDLADVPSRLAGESFDVVLVPGLIHLLDDPAALLGALGSLLSQDGVLVASFPNLAHATVVWRRLAGHPAYRGLGDFGKSGIHPTSPALVRRWLKQAGLRLGSASSVVTGRWTRFDRATLGMLTGLWAAEYLIVAHLGQGAKRPAPAGGQGRPPLQPGTAGTATAGSRAHPQATP
ncbi:MAG: methyltransferase domain-containing protein [Pseudomonadota bacterium]|nr:methyltransferase domain-containing protein [Pseudomonadota bacterium]